MKVYGLLVCKEIGSNGNDEVGNCRYYDWMLNYFTFFPHVILVILDFSLLRNGSYPFKTGKMSRVERGR